jgi:predicted DsbA family dithiol-disulfide isomerase
VSLRTLEDEFGDKLTVNWRGYMLRPQQRATSLEKFTGYTASWARPESMPGSPVFAYPWSSAEPPTPWSLPSGIAVKAAARQQRFTDYHLALMKAYFEQHRDPGSRSTLFEVAVELGLDQVRFEADLDDPVLEEELQKDFAEARELGITGIPTVVVDGDVLTLPGAQELDLYRHIVNRRLKQVQAEQGRQE